LKEQALREGKAVDGIANVLKALIVPLEEHLDKQERFVEIRAEEQDVLSVHGSLTAFKIVEELAAINVKTTEAAVKNLLKSGQANGRFQLGEDGQWALMPD
jgi:hypothetical protein